jgi:hypothetical protein
MKEVKNWGKPTKNIFSSLSGALQSERVQEIDKGDYQQAGDHK